ncbi:leucine Rich repeat-containing domain protein, partial [Cooperia oncophora]
MLQGDSMTCISLNETTFSALSAHLATAEWSGLKTLAIHRTPSLSLDLMPTLTFLEVLDLSDNSPNDVRKLIIERNNFTVGLHNDVFLISTGDLKIERGFLAPFPRLEELHLGHNRISYIGYDSLRMPQIRIIRLNDNLIQTLGMHAFRFIPQLHDIDLSGNRIERFMLEVLDLSSNNLTQVPGLELRSMEGLRTLLLAKNPITVIGEGQARLDSLQWLDLSSSEVRVVEAGAFSHFPRLHSVFFNGCRNLTFISPAAFENISVFRLCRHHSGQRLPRIRIADVPLDCGCLSEQLNAITTTTITDWSNATCVTREGEVLSVPNLSPTSLASSEQCRPNVVLPFGHEVVASVGQTFKIYCAGTEEDDIVKWKSPNGVTEYAIRPE